MRLICSKINKFDKINKSVKHTKITIQTINGKISINAKKIKTCKYSKNVLIFLNKVIIKIIFIYNIIIMRGEFI